MPKTGSHHTDTRTFRGEPTGAPVAEFLNRSTGRGRERVLELFGLLRKLAEYGDFGLHGIWASTKNDSDFAKIVADINGRMARYKTARMLWPAIGPMRVLGGSKVLECQFKNLPSSRSARAFAECEAALRIADLAEMGLLGSVTQCECKHPSGGQWFFARFAHQRFCSDECRIRYNASSPQAKAYRAKKAREYYRHEKDLREKARKGVRR